MILDIGGREPTSPEHAMRILGSFEKGEPLKITIMREQEQANARREAAGLADCPGRTPRARMTSAPRRVARSAGDAPPTRVERVA